MNTSDAVDKQFTTDAEGTAFLAEVRWPHGVPYPRCERTEKIDALKARPFH